MFTAVILTATGIVSVFFMCMAYAANTDSKTNAYETACRDPRHLPASNRLPPAQLQRPRLTRDDEKNKETNPTTIERTASCSAYCPP